MLQKVENSIIEYLNNFDKKRIMVIGDLMIDEYIEGEVTRVSPEAPVPVVKLNGGCHKSFGGAGNVFTNLISLGCKAVGLVGTIGSDVNGNFIIDHVKSLDQPTNGLFTVPDSPTTTKTRVTSGGHHIVRLDKEDNSLRPESTLDHLYHYIRHIIKDYDVIIISDYEKGLLDKEFIGLIISECHSANVPCFVDPKNHNFKHYKEVDLIMPNINEVLNFTGIEVRNSADAYEAAMAIKLKLDCKTVIVKMGEKGMFVLGHAVPNIHINSNAKHVFDVTGAGDTAIATLALSYAAGAIISESALIANAAAGYVVGQIGTTTIDRSKLGDEICKIKEGYSV